jgi:high-affinity Fe2+/Pb2+ permease
MNDPVWNICDCCSNSDEPWGIFRALFGYNCKPTPWEILIYCLYWVCAITYLTFAIRVLCFKNVRRGVVKEKLCCRKRKTLDSPLTEKAGLYDSPVLASAELVPVATAAPIAGVDKV